jgi:Putative transposase
LHRRLVAAANLKDRGESGAFNGLWGTFLLIFARYRRRISLINDSLAAKNRGAEPFWPKARYAKPPFAGPEAVLAYLARYTHRVAISSSRLGALDERGVTFRYKDYRRNGQARYRTKTLSADEFIRRFPLHVLPKGFIASAITGCWPADNRHLKFSAVQPAIAFASL